MNTGVSETFNLSPMVDRDQYSKFKQSKDKIGDLTSDQNQSLDKRSSKIENMQITEKDYQNATGKSFG